MTAPVLFLSSCAMVGPDYQRPSTDVASTWDTSDGQTKSNKSISSVTEQPARNEAWWNVFHDPVLTSLIQEGYHHNLSLQSTGVSVLQARAQLAQSVGELYPQQQGMSGNYTHQEIGEGNTLTSLIPSSFDTDAVTFSSTWEADFWGKYRRAIRSNDATFLASLAAYDQALVTLTADIASCYMSIRTYAEQIHVTQTNIQIQKESLRIAKARFNSGQVSLLDVEQALTQLNQTEASLPALIVDLQEQKDTMAVLLGTTPNKVDALLRGHKPIPLAPTTIAVGIPKDLLRQRPDVHEAELKAIAQSEAIGAVKAQLYPALSLSGSFGYNSSNIGQSSTNDIFQWSNHTVSIGPAVSLPLLNYGQITNQVREQDAVFQQAILNYQNTVLNAQKEVQDGITSYIQSQKALQSLVIANKAAEKTTQLALIRYKAGEADYTTVLDAEQEQLAVQTSLTNAQGGIPQAVVSLYRALGGGWQMSQGHDVVSDKIKREMAERTNWGSLLEQPNHEAPTIPMQQMKQTALPSW